MGLSYTGNRCLFVTRVSGFRRLPAPPARTTPFMYAPFSLRQVTCLTLAHKDYPYASDGPQARNADLLATPSRALASFPRQCNSPQRRRVYVIGPSV